MISSPASPVYWPVFESQTSRPLDDEYRLCNDIICKAAQFWQSDTLLSFQLVLESGETFNSVELVRANGSTVPVAVVASTGPDGRFYISIQNFDTSPWVGQTITFRTNLNGFSDVYDSWPVRIVAPGQCERELSVITYSGYCVENGIYWDGSGVTELNFFMPTSVTSMDLQPDISSFVAGDGTLRICSNESQEVWNTTFDFAPLGIIRKIGYMIYSRNLAFNSAPVRVLTSIALDLQYGSYQVFRSQVQFTMTEKIRHISECCP